MKKSLLIPVIILLLGTFLFVSCSQSTPTTTISSPPTTTTSSAPTTTTSSTPLSTIKIGHILNLTGTEASVGDIYKRSLEYSLEILGNKMAGHPVEIVIGDAAGDASKAVDVARKMVENDHVVAILGPTDISQKMAIAAYASQAHIPMLPYNPTPLSLFQGSTANKWVIGTHGSDLQAPTCMADYLYNHLGYKTIATLTQDNAGGRSFLNPLMDAFKAYGGQVVQSQWVPVPCPDFAPYLTTLKTADALVAWDAGSDAIALLTQYHQMGIDKKMPLVGAFYGGFLDSYILAAMSDNDVPSVVGVITAMGYAPDSQDQANQDFIKFVTPKFGFTPSYEGPAAVYQAVLVLNAALTATKGDTTPDTLLKALTSVQVSGPIGTTSFPAGMACANVNMSIVKVAQYGAKAFGYATVYTYQNVPPTGYTSGK